MTRHKSGLTPGLLLAACAIATSVQAQSSATLRITNFQVAPSGPALSWPLSATGTAYTVQYQDTLQDGIWRVPAGAVRFPIASNYWVDGSVPQGMQESRFYRVVGVPEATRGKLLSVTLNSSLPLAELGYLFTLAGLPVTPQYAVLLYKVDYETITPLGARTTASGALILPATPNNQALPMVSYQHGTLTQTNSAPSAINLLSDILDSEVVIGVAFAATGYAAVMPDYLGMGDSPGLHPYLHAASEASACVDMLRASRSACTNLKASLDGRLFLCGYSQGGHATMALCREIETYHTNEFTITACAPMAGPYDLSGTTASDFLTGVPAPNPYYFLYLLASYQNVYHLGPSLSNLLVAPYSATLPPLMNGNSTSSQLNAAMPANPITILNPDYLAAFRSDPRQPLWLALEDNDLYHWKPRAPMQLYQCSGDQDVDPANASVALATFHALGATQVQLIDPLVGADHGACAEPSLVEAKAWFDSLR